MALDIFIIGFLIVLGVALFMAEIFLLPGITIAGFAGAAALIGGVVYAFMYVGDTAGYITIVVTAIATVGSLVYLIKSKAINRIALDTQIDATVDQTELKQVSVGDEGIALSRLNPIGKAEFRGVTVEAKSVTGEYIDEHEPIRVVQIESNNVLVESMNEN